MNKFKVGDRVKVKNYRLEFYQSAYVYQVGTVVAYGFYPTVRFDDGKELVFNDVKLAKMKPKNKTKTYIVSKQYLEAICSVRSTVGDEIEVTVVSE